MTTPIVTHTDGGIRRGWHPDPGRSFSLHADAYTRPEWFEIDQRRIVSRSWQWICHGENLRESGSSANSAYDVSQATVTDHASAAISTASPR